MKIEIDLNEILGDENGAETLQESVRRQVIEGLSEKIKDGIKHQIDQAVSRTISDELSIAIKEQMPKIVDDLLNAEFCPVSSWGEPSGPTTFRKQLIKSITEQMVYEPALYSNDKNAFTTAVDAVIDEKLKEFKTQFNKKVDSQFIQDAMAFATAKLHERLKV